MKSALLHDYDEYDPSVGGHSVKYVFCQDHENLLEIAGLPEQSPQWAESALKQTLKLIREQTLMNVYGKNSDVRSLDSLSSYEFQITQWLEKRRTQTSSGKVLEWSPQGSSLPLGEGLLDFLYADFAEIAKYLPSDLADKRYDVPNRCTANKATQILYDYLCLSETLKYFAPLITSSVYSSMFPPIMSTRTAYSSLRYLHFLLNIQDELYEIIQFVFDPDFHSEALGSLSASQRYVLYCISHNVDPQFQYTSFFDCPVFEKDPETHFTLNSVYRNPAHHSLAADAEEFCTQHKIHTSDYALASTLSFPFFAKTQITTIPDMLMYELSQMLTHHVQLKECKRCGKYFIVKGNYDCSYCSRTAPGEARTCQEIAAQEKYKKKMADNAAIPLYQKYYKRYYARMKVKQIKEPAFKKWKYQAVVKRDACTDGKITLEEFAQWLEGSFENRKKKG